MGSIERQKQRILSGIPESLWDILGPSQENEEESLSRLEISYLRLRDWEYKRRLLMAFQKKHSLPLAPNDSLKHTEVVKRVKERCAEHRRKIFGESADN